MKLSLYQKAIALLSITFLVQIGLFIWYGKLVSYVEKLEATEARSRLVIGHLNWLTVLVDNAVIGRVGQSEQPKSLEYSKLLQQAHEQIPLELRSLKELFARDAEQLTKVEKLENLINRLLAQLIERDDLFANGKFFAKPEVKAIAIEIPLTRREILSTEEKRIDLDFTQALPQARAAVKTQIAVAVILNIAGALILMLFFTRTIARRLEVISENSLRLTRREPLLEPLAGVDEISQLDQTLHSVAGKLSEMEILKQQFVAMVGHDLRSPLTSIRLYFDSLESGVYGDISPSLRKMSNVAMRNTLRLIELVNDLLDIEKFESGTFDLDLQSIDLDSILNDTVESMRQVAKESRVSINVVESSERLKADPERLTQVFMNLLSNAIKYSPVDGKINIFCSNLGKELEISFQDEGRGIAPEYHQIIFDRFKQIEQSDSQRGRGTGLGLAICKAIVEQHHGSIGVVSEVGKGSRFWVKLPIEQPVGIKL